MDIDITNITKDKFDVIQGDILRVLIKHGLVDVETILLSDLENNFIGVQLEVNIQEN